MVEYLTNGNAKQCPKEDKETIGQAVGVKNDKAQQKKVEDRQGNAKVTFEKAGDQPLQARNESKDKNRG